ncbi:MAG: molybdopterin cofactor-binding domain-containing protein [Steroidobacteraceae bacterium]
MTPTLSRRGFTAGLGALVIGFSLDGKWSLAQTRLPGSLNDNRMLDAWIRIDGQGLATVCTGKVELGQGIVTALAQIAAEELDLPLSRVQMISGDTSRTPDEGQTSGSQSIENSGTALRLAGAEVRSLLVAQAARQFGVAADSLSVSNGVITAADGRRVTYGQLAGDLSLRREATGAVKPKDAATYTIVGTRIPRADFPAKVTGQPSYVQDVRLPGMVHGRIVRAPRYGATLASFDQARIAAMPGVVAVVRDGNFLGVVAEREEQAVAARTALIASAVWTGGRDLPDPAHIHDALMALPTEDKVISDKQAAVPADATSLSATYRKPYLSHASIGPSCAVAQFAEGKWTVWTQSQGVFPLQEHMTGALRVPASDIHCIHVPGAGCYGHNGADDVALDAALLARAVPGRPVRVQWMREDEFAWAPYGAAMTMRLQAAIKGQRIVDWNYDVWSNTHTTRPGEPGGVNLLAAWDISNPVAPAPPRMIAQPAGGGDRNAIPLYDFPRQHVVNHLIKPMPIRVSALRTLGAYANVWATESFVDELALLAGADPVALRLAHLSDPRARAVIERVATMARWRAGDKGDGTRGRGIGFARYKTLACYVAVIAEIEVDRATGAIRVPEVYVAADAGQIINPDGLANQMEGGVIQSTSWTLKESMSFTRERVTTHDWASYPILRFPEVPRVTVELINRPGERSLGAGEGSQGPTVAAIANAFTHATGKRLRDLPLGPDRVKAALS